MLFPEDFILLVDFIQLLRTVYCDTKICEVYIALPPAGLGNSCISKPLSAANLALGLHSTV